MTTVTPPARHRTRAVVRTPRGPRQQRQPTAGTDAKRERILRAAEALFDRQGFERTTIEQIAAELGVSKPYVYYYFKDKQQLFEMLCWAPTVACFTVLDDPADAARPAHERLRRGLAALIERTLTHHPAAFFPYREPQVFRPEYQAAQRRLARHFYDQLAALIETARAEGQLQVDEPMIAALAACSLPGFLYQWYRPGGRLKPEAVAAELTRLAWRLLGLREPG